jgi:hypothetical protein
MMRTGLATQRHLPQRVSPSLQSQIRFQAADHDHSQCNGHHHDQEPQKPFSLTETLVNLGTWFKEFFTGLWQDMIYLLKGPEAKEPEAKPPETDGHQHGPNCDH